MKMSIEVEYNEPADALLAINFATTVLTVGTPENYQNWTPLYSYLPENQWVSKVIGRFRIEA